ncbi:Biofilm regulatory protein A [Frankliniella fusca]|uniref:Biofilm regulatory protein A n=1 Tax=Frankliniella fusca TaxID=407009 RepID=A0AAE1L7V4_9NEOP|nr:Biofilm regulatory protein A [Frankliniella fusca]
MCGISSLQDLLLGRRVLTLVTVVCVALVALPAVSEAQYRPSYFPRPGGFSQTLPQYGSSSGGGAGGDTELGNRDNNPANTMRPLPAPGSSAAVEDTELANRVQEWPQAVQPFWFLNQQAIAQHVGQRVPCQGPGCPGVLVGPAPQASFIGGGGRGSGTGSAGSG